MESKETNRKNETISIDADHDDYNVYDAEGDNINNINNLSDSIIKTKRIGNHVLMIKSDSDDDEEENTMTKGYGNEKQ